MRTEAPVAPAQAPALRPAAVLGDRVHVTSSPPPVPGTLHPTAVFGDWLHGTSTPLIPGALQPWSLREPPQQQCLVDWVCLTYRNHNGPDRNKLELTDRTLDRN